MYMKKMLAILIIVLLSIFSLLIYFIYNEIKISNEIAKIEERQLTREEEAKIEPYVELTPNGYVLNDNPSFFLLSITTVGWQ